MIIDVFSCMYVRRVRAHVTHVTRDSVNEKVRKMILEGMSHAKRKRKKEKSAEANGNQRKSFFQNSVSRCVYISIYITARINILRQCDLLCVILNVKRDVRKRVFKGVFYITK